MNNPLFEIENSISDMGIIVGKGMVALDAMMQDYFNKPSDSIGGPSTCEINSVDDPTFAILNDYCRFQTIGEIAFDYFDDLEKKLYALEKRIDELRKEAGTAAPMIPLSARRWPCSGRSRTPQLSSASMILPIAST